MSRTKWTIAACLVATAASCQLVSGVGDYSFEESGPGSGGAGAAGTGGAGTGGAGGTGGAASEIGLSWAYQLSLTSGELFLTSLFPADDAAAVLLGHFDGTVQFNNKLDPDDMFTVTATSGAENGFVFVARGGAGADMSPRFTIEGTDGSVVEPHAVALTETDTGFFVVGTVEGDLANSSLNNPAGSKLIVGEWDTMGEPQWTTSWAYSGLGADVTVTNIFRSGSGSSEVLYVAGYSSASEFALTADLGIPQGTDGFVAKLRVDAMKNGDLEQRVAWARAFRGVGMQRIVDFQRFGSAFALYGDYAGSLVYHDDLGATTLGPNGGLGSLFLLLMDDGGNLDSPKNRFFESSGGAATATSIAPSNDGHLLATGHFKNELTTVTKTLTAVGNQALFIGEYTTGLGETYAETFGGANGNHEMAGAGYLDLGGGPKVAVFAARCIQELSLSPDMIVTSDSFDVCTAVLVENPDPLSTARYLPFSISRLGDEQSTGDTLDQVPTALVTRGSEVIIYGTFRGTLISPDLFSNNKTEEDGFVFALDAAPMMQ